MSWYPQFSLSYSRFGYYQLKFIVYKERVLRFLQTHMHLDSSTLSLTPARKKSAQVSSRPPVTYSVCLGDLHLPSAALQVSLPYRMPGSIITLPSTVSGLSRIFTPSELTKGLSGLSSCMAAMFLVVSTMRFAGGIAESCKHPILVSFPVICSRDTYAFFATPYKG